MSTQSNVNLRSNEELEGTLLPSTEIKSNILPSQMILPPSPPPRNPSYAIESDSNETLIVEEAVPLLPFDIEDSNSNDKYKGKDEDDDERLFGILAATSTAGREHTVVESSRIQTGTSVGQMNKLEENFEIKKGKKQASAKQHNEREAIKVANQMAKIRVKQEREGFTKHFVPERIEDMKEKKTSEKKNSNTIGYSSYGSKGYETSSYEVSDYKSDYEYKSVYD